MMLCPCPRWVEQDVLLSDKPDIKVLRGQFANHVVE